MVELGEGRHFAFGLIEESSFFRGQHVVGIYDTLGLHHSGVVLLCERHEITLAHAELLEDLTGMTTWRRCRTRPIRS